MGNAQYNFFRDSGCFEDSDRLTVPDTDRSDQSSRSGDRSIRSGEPVGDLSDRGSSPSSDVIHSSQSESGASDQCEAQV